MQNIKMPNNGSKYNRGLKGRLDQKGRLNKSDRNHCWTATVSLPTFLCDSITKICLNSKNTDNKCAYHLNKRILKNVLFYYNQPYWEYMYILQKATKSSLFLYLIFPTAWCDLAQLVNKFKESKFTTTWPILGENMYSGLIHFLHYC